MVWWNKHLFSVLVLCILQFAMPPNASFACLALISLQYHPPSQNCFYLRPSFIFFISLSYAIQLTGLSMSRLFDLTKNCATIVDKLKLSVWTELKVILCLHTTVCKLDLSTSCLVSFEILFAGIWYTSDSEAAKLGFGCSFGIPLTKY